MKSYSTSFPAKLLLFGEHTVLFGSEAIAFPIGNYTARLSYNSPIRELQPILLEFVDFLKKQKNLQILDFEALESEFQKGLGFESSIPIGYGLGSSGALCAAIYDSFVHNKNHTIEEVRELLSIMESFFHGKSSGLDPLVCYYQCPVLIGKEGLNVLNHIALSQIEDSRMFILDSNIKREASAQITLFKERMLDKLFSSNIIQHYIPLVETAIQATLTDDKNSLKRAFIEISLFQLQHFQFLIPATIQSIWKKGIDSGDYYLKIGGAGGGGIFLGIASDIESCRTLVSPYNIAEIQPF